MSESVVSAAEREALERARADVAALRRGYHRRLQDIAALDQLGTAGNNGYRSLEALVADHDNLDRGEANRLVAEAADLCARTTLQGEQLPARLPGTAEGLSAGAIDPAHVKVIREAMRHLAGLMTPPPPEELLSVERTLAEKARLLPPKMLRQLAKGFIDFYDPDGAAPPDGEDAADELRMLRRRDGSLVFKGRLGDPLDAEMMVEVIGVLAAPAGSEDPRTVERRQIDALKDLIADARGPRGLATDTRHGQPDPDAATCSGEQTETAAGESTARAEEPDEATAGPEDPDEPAAGAERVADGGGSCSGAERETGSGGEAGSEGESEAAGEAPSALIPEPRRSATAKAGGRGWTERPGRVLLTVTIDHRWLCDALEDQGGPGGRGGRSGYGTLDSGHHVDAATIRRWACDAEIIPMLLGSRSEPLDVGRAQRTAPDAIRRALNIRDRGCAFPGCDRRPRRCQAHHVRAWYADGATALDNMCLLCRYHHTLVHHGHWTIEMIDGRPWFSPPWYIDPERQPRLGGRPRVPT